MSMQSLHQLSKNCGFRDALSQQSLNVAVETTSEDKNEVTAVLSSANEKCLFCGSKHVIPKWTAQLAKPFIISVKKRLTYERFKNSQQMDLVHLRTTSNMSAYYSQIQSAEFLYGCENQTFDFYLPYFILICILF